MSDNHAQRPLAYRTVRGGVWVLGSAYWTIGFGFTANILLTRLLVPEYYGEFALAFFFYTLFQLRNKIALSIAFAKYHENDGTALGTYWGMDVSLGAGGLLLTFAASPVLLVLGYSRIAVAMSLLMAITAFSESFLSVVSVSLDKELRFRPGSIINSISMPLSYIPAFGFALTGRGQYSLIAQFLAYAVVSQLGLFLYSWRNIGIIRKEPWRFSLSIARSFFRYGAVTGIGNALASTTTQVDNFILGTIKGPTVLGYYDRAYRTAQWPGLLLNALIARSAFFTYSRLQNDYTRLQKTIEMVVWICATVAIPIALVLGLCAPELVPLLYGPQWAPSVPLVQVLLVASVIRPIWENYHIVFVATGRPVNTIVMASIQLVFLVGIAIPLTNWQGALGTALAAVIAMCISVAIGHWQLRAIVDVRIGSTFGIPMVAASIVVFGYALVLFVLQPAIAVSWTTVLIKATSGLLAYASLSFALQPTNTLVRISYVWRLLRQR